MTSAASATQTSRGFSGWAGVVLVTSALLTAGCATRSGGLDSPRPPVPPAIDREAFDSAVARGRDFLVRSQNADGSWGSPRNTKALNIYAPVPGAHHAFRAACTALSLQSLAMTDNGSADVAAARGRGLEWLLGALPRVKRATPDTMYNIWAHTYALQALLAERSSSVPALRKRIDEAIRQQIDQLERYTVLDGGWAYYDFVAQTQVPSGSSTTFVTAAALLALDEARESGFEVNPRVTSRAVAALKRQQNPNFGYLYGEYLTWWPNSGPNRPEGGLGRAQVCNLALRRWGDERIGTVVFTTWLDRLIARQLWMDMGRKRPRPHESWFAVAGYYYYFGHYYAARVVNELPPEPRGFYARHLVSLMLAHQEKEGSWWDFPLYDYHRFYGTPFALMTLKQCEAAALDPEQ